MLCYVEVGISQINFKTLVLSGRSGTHPPEVILTDSVVCWLENSQITLGWHRKELSEVVVLEVVDKDWYTILADFTLGTTVSAGQRNILPVCWMTW